MSLDLQLPDESITNRRQADRPQPPKPCKSIYLVLMTDKCARNIFESRFKSIIVISLFVISVFMIIWNLSIRLPSIDDSILQLDHLMVLEIELEELKQQWSEDELKEIEKSINKAQTTIFDDFSSLADWLIEKNNHAAELGLAMSYKMKQQQTTNLEKTFSLPLEITLKVKPGVTDKIYARVLEFIRSLVNEQLHLEIAGNKLISDGKEIQHVRLDINVWVRDAAAMLNNVNAGPEANTEVSADVPFVQ